MLKKTMAIVLAVVMTLALAIPAFATGSADEGAVTNPSSGYASSEEKTEGTVSVDYTSVTRVPYLDIQIQGKGAVILNPYQIKYTTNTATGFGNSSATDFNIGTGKNGQIISSPLILKSKTLAPVQVGVKVKTTVDDPNKTNSTKAISLLTAMPTNQELGKDSSKPNATTQKKVCMWICADTTEAAAIAVDPFSTTYKTSEYKPFLLLAATVQGKADPENKKLFKIDEYGGSGDAKTCCLMFNGAMIPEPVDNPWTKNDKITPEVTITLNVLRVTQAAGNGS